MQLQLCQLGNRIPVLVLNMLNDFLLSSSILSNLEKKIIQYYRDHSFEQNDAICCFCMVVNSDN